MPISPPCPAAPVNFTPVNFTVDGLTYHGLAFGPEKGAPVLALHGWLDNAASFARLARALPDLRIVAVDLSGHGLSDHRSADATYQIWDDLPQLVGILDALGWNSCTLLGHSRGAMICTLLAAALPDRVTALITLDAMLPMTVQDGDFVTHMHSFLSDRVTLAQKPGRVFASVDDFITRRSRNGEPATVAAALAQRALKPTDTGLVWRGDARLNGGSAMKLNMGQCTALLQALTMPVLNIWATPRPSWQAGRDATLDAISTYLPSARTVHIDGHHHWHMDEDSGEKIANEIRAFLET